MEYSGEDNLDVMNLAHNHIQYITDEIINAGITEAKGKIVDFGAGNGLYAGKLQDILGTSILCIEPADNMLPYLKGFQTRKNIEELTEKAGFIYSLDVLEHIEDDTSVLKQIYETMLPKGKLFLHVPAFQFLYSAMDKKVGHYRRYSRKELIAKCRSAGFRVTKCRYMDFCGFFASVVYKYLPSTDGSLNPKLLVSYDKFVIPLSRLLDKVTLGSCCGKNLILTAVKD